MKIHDGAFVSLARVTTYALTSALLLSTTVPVSARFVQTRRTFTETKYINGQKCRVREPGIPEQLPEDWVSRGCYTDSVARRTFTGAMFADLKGMTVESCVTFCADNGFVYAGTEYGQECFCGNFIPKFSTLTPSADCSMACTGNASEACGGPDRLNVFLHEGITLPPPPVLNPGVGNWTNTGCYTDSVNARTLEKFMGSDGSTTVANCLATCEAQGYTIAGVEYGRECFCGKSLQNGGTPAPDGYTGCYMPCEGKPTETCGGPKRLNLYKFNVTTEPPTTSTAQEPSSTIKPPTEPTTTTKPPTSPTGEPQPTTKPPTTTKPPPTTVPSTTNEPPTSKPPTTTEPSTTTKPPPTTQPPTTEPSPTTKPPTTNEPSSTTKPPTTSEPTSNPPTTTTTTNPPTTEPTTTTKPPTTEPSTTTKPPTTEPTTTTKPPTTEPTTTTKPPTTTTTTTTTTKPPTTSETSTTTKPSSTTKPPTQTQSPGPQQTGLPGQWEYQKCLAEGSVRALPFVMDLDNKNSATSCLTLCAQYGYPAAGLSASEQCLCGDVADLSQNGVKDAPEGDCSMKCSGAQDYVCGGRNRTSYYRWKGDLNTWHTPRNTGKYEFLVGGVVVPLIATLATNNKITLVEKEGTGPANTTGAYELDVSLAGDFKRAWRTMNVKSDVFCSGSLTLPDKVGRQINVGGWSRDSLYGVRLYWPDGSPGKESKNDWQEDYNELRLQRGRWYPGALIMTNGSILIVGGSDGLDGPPEDTLEILPKPAGGSTLVKLDWLERTDPYNLYPFLHVLPGGGILVLYYNEARILDERTFATTKVLPNIPGIINETTAGRNYPMEGSAVLLPQYAPYTDPITVMTCGGATRKGIALDNCASIQPEVPNAQWLIERMPSKRVMPCMVSLPDGTFLIVNGAHQGLGGSRRASSPNLNAVLYDPRQPVGSRFSILGSTTIPRMYHSEAILLQDGRVLITGSDQGDPRFPLEYRVEVFIPPYLSSGNKQPTFTIRNTDWSYNGKYTIDVRLFQGTTANMRVSLLAAVSSTHGSSMNQRILFPSFSCSGNACTITAPPNVHVCPPGWFQLYILDGPTPSWSTWVRIGGDPARLGNWPPSSKFSKPGM